MGERVLINDVGADNPEEKKRNILDLAVLQFNFMSIINKNILRESVEALIEDGLLLPMSDSTNAVKVNVVNGRRLDISVLVNDAATISVLCKVPLLLISISTPVLGLEPFIW